MVSFHAIRQAFSLALFPITLGCTIAAYYLVFCGPLSKAEIADDPAFIFVSYVGAFGPIEAVSSIPLLDSTWRTLRSTRALARLYAFIIIMGVLTTGLYADVQRVSGDYKELAASVIVLLFSVLNIYNISFLEIQLVHFRIWAATSIKTLRRRNIQVEIRQNRISAAHTDLVAMLHYAGLLKVNDSIIHNTGIGGRMGIKFTALRGLYDNVNQFSRENSAEGADHLHSAEEGRFGTSVRNNGPGGQAEISTPETGVSQQSNGNANGIRTCRCIGLIISMVQHVRLALIKIDVMSRNTESWYLPAEPKELWMDWAVAFTAQVLKPSLRLQADSTADEQSVPGAQQGSSQDANQHVEIVPARYIPSQNKASEIQQQFPDFESYLQEAMNCGIGLPFDCPQYYGRDGYKSLQHKLSRVLEGMPAEFGPEISNFDITMLEHLTVILHGKHDVSLPVEMDSGAGSGAQGDLRTRLQLVRDRICEAVQDCSRAFQDLNP